MSVDAEVEVVLGTLRLDVHLRVDDGEVVALLGPNGAGKTTLLRALAGLQPLTGGRLQVDDEVLDDPGRRILVPPEHRPGAFVFQDHMLFPHLTARANVAFGPRSRGVARRVADQSATGWLDRMGLAAQADDKPRALSGGQAQRVALARALATDPRLLLLDEPLSALDITARGAVRRELKEHLRDFTGSCVLVTHDPLDAAVIADRLVILEGGRVIQEGTVAEVTARPRSVFVADLMGINLLSGTSAGTTLQVAGTTLTTATATEGTVFAIVPPSAIALHRAPPEGSPRNCWATVVDELYLVGERARVRLAGPLPLVAEVTPAALADLDVSEGSAVWVAVKATQIVVYPA